MSLTTLAMVVMTRLRPGLSINPHNGDGENNTDVSNDPPFRLVRIMVFIIQRSVNNHPWTNIGVLVRDSGATVDWSAVDNVLTKICGPRPDDGNWVKFFNKFDFDLDATCKD